MRPGYQRIIVHGDPYERGQSHGQQARDKILLNLNRYKTSTALPPPEQWPIELYRRAIRDYFPNGLEEMQGIADGSGISVEDVILLNARYDLSRMTGTKVGECTTMSYHGAEGSTIIAQNWDMSSWLCDLDTIIVLESHCSGDEDTEMVHIALTEAGQLARSGMNSFGLAIVANSLWTSEDRPPTKPVLPFSLARRMFLECHNFAEGVKTCCVFPRHVSGNLLLASSFAALDVEVTPRHHFVVHPKPVSAMDDSELLTHANHFASSPVPVEDGYPGGSSLFRDVRLEKLLRTTAKGRRLANLDMTVDDIKKAFANHDSFPRSICEHSNKRVTNGIGAPSTVGGSSTMTVACVVYDLGRREMHVCTGNPCEALKAGEQGWQVYRL